MRQKRQTLKLIRRFTSSMCFLWHEYLSPSSFFFQPLYPTLISARAQPTLSSSCTSFVSLSSLWPQRSSAFWEKKEKEKKVGQGTSELYQCLVYFFPRKRKGWERTSIYDDPPHLAKSVGSVRVCASCSNMSLWQNQSRVWVCALAPLGLKALGIAKV